MRSGLCGAWKWFKCGWKTSDLCPQISSSTSSRFERQLRAAAPAEEVEPSGLKKTQFPVLESFIQAVAPIVFSNGDGSTSIAPPSAAEIFTAAEKATLPGASRAAVHPIACPALFFPHQVQAIGPGGCFCPPALMRNFTLSWPICWISSVRAVPPAPLFRLSRLRIMRNKEKCQNDQDRKSCSIRLVSANLIRP